MKVGDKVRFVKGRFGYEVYNSKIKIGSIGKVVSDTFIGSTLCKVRFRAGDIHMFKSELELIHDIKYFPSMITTLTWGKK